MMRTLGSGRLPDPSWKSGPPDPPQPHGEHAINSEPAIDLDGVGQDEAESLTGQPLLAVREAYSCLRDGCNVRIRKHHLYATASISRRLMDALEYASDYNVAEYFHEHALIVGHDGEVPIIGVRFGDDVFGQAYPQRTRSEGFDSPCYGRVEPNPDVHAHRHEEL